LGRQHLDVYFPDKNIGIEYQGIQHDEPTEHFGGEDGLINRQKLDERKRTLCKEHNCYLIYVLPDYSFSNVKKDIKRLIKLTKN